jgi:hypothetical protein
MIAAAGLLALAVSPPAHAQSCTIANPAKVGVGAWDLYGAGRMAADMQGVRSRWYYDWQSTASAPPEYVPMIWSAQHVAHAAGAPGDTLLTFNEPDNPARVNMSVEAALAHWPELMATGKRLSSPAVTTGNELGSASWLGGFMAEAERRAYRVDFIAVHYYPTDPSIAAFERYLADIHEAYDRPIWVTEWSLADWNDPTRFTEAEQAEFLRAGAELLDDLPYVERHAWFGLYEGMDGWHLNSGLYEEAGRTEVGDAFLALLEC